MVKKFGGIAIVCVYFLLTLGMQLHFHYCCGELADLHLFSSAHCGHNEQQDEDHCCKKSNCCSFIHLDLKVDDSHQPSENFRLLPIDVAQPIACYSTSEPSVISRPGFTSVSHSPPPISKRYVLYQALVLYA